MCLIFICKDYLLLLKSTVYSAMRRISRKKFDVYLAVSFGNIRSFMSVGRLSRCKYRSALHMAYFLEA